MGFCHSHVGRLFLLRAAFTHVFSSVSSTHPVIRGDVRIPFAAIIFRRVVFRKVAGVLSIGHRCGCGYRPPFRRGAPCRLRRATCAEWDVVTWNFLDMFGIPLPPLLLGGPTGDVFNVLPGDF